MGQQVMDTVETKGYSYGIGYLLSDVVTGILTAKGAGKISKVGKAGKVTKVIKLKELVRKGVNGIDDLVRYGIRSADDLARAGVKSVNDLAKLGVTLDDLKKMGLSAGDLAKAGIKVSGKRRKVKRVTKGNSGNKTSGQDIVFGSDTKSSQRLANQMNQRGWTTDSVKGVVDNPYTTRTSTNLATGNPSTVYYNKQGGYVIVDNVTKAIVKISDNINPSTWTPDVNIVDPYKP